LPLDPLFGVAASTSGIRVRGRRSCRTRAVAHHCAVPLSEGLQVLCPQGFDEAIDAATLLDQRGEFRARGYAHADAFDDDVDDGETIAGVAQSPIDADALSRGHVDPAMHDDRAAILGAGAHDLDALAEILAEAHRI